MARSCQRCKQPPRAIDAAVAATLYSKLKPMLGVVPSWGCYTPRRGEREAGDHGAWPLHSWRGPGSFPLVIGWNPRATHRPTFAEFCLVYGLDLEERSDG